MSKSSCEGIGAVVVTLPAAESVMGGQVVSLDEQGQAIACAADHRLCGVALEPRGGYAAVQVGGFARVKCEDSTVAPGFLNLCGDGKGGVKKTSGGTVGEFLVVEAGGGSAVIRL